MIERRKTRYVLPQEAHELEDMLGDAFAYKILLSVERTILEALRPCSCIRNPGLALNLNKIRFQYEQIHSPQLHDIHDRSFISPDNVSVEAEIHNSSQRI